MKTKSLTFLGTALVLAMTGTAVRAETGSKPPSEIRMSREGMELLCKDFPMNSRCAKNPTTSSQSQPQSNEMTPTPSSSDAQPSEMTPTPNGSDAQPGEMTPAPSGSTTQPRM